MNLPNAAAWNDTRTAIDAARADTAAFIIRIGLGSVFVVGGWWKLSRALDPERSGALAERYMAGDGYINAFFAQYLFDGPMGVVLTPLIFLTLLSAFELLCGLAFLAGAFVRALSFVYAFLLWSFVIALPVTTTPDAVPTGGTYLSPAILVQIRDIGLSGMCFVLLNLGSGRWSLDQMAFGRGYPRQTIDWNAYGLVLRLSVALVFLVGGFFAGYDHIKSYVPVPLLLIAVGLVLASGHAVRAAALAAGAVLLWYSLTKLSFETSAWNNLNAIKRELAYLAACGVLGWFGGGEAYRPAHAWRAPARTFLGSMRSPT